MWRGAACCPCVPCPLSSQIGLDSHMRCLLVASVDIWAWPLLVSFFRIESHSAGTETPFGNQIDKQTNKQRYKWKHTKSSCTNKIEQTMFSLAVYIYKHVVYMDTGKGIYGMERRKALQEEAETIGVSWLHFMHSFGSVRLALRRKMQ